jgi:hypothetical protein
VSGVPARLMICPSSPGHGIFMSVPARNVFAGPQSRARQNTTMMIT